MVQKKCPAYFVSYYVAIGGSNKVHASFDIFVFTLFSAESSIVELSKRMNDIKRENDELARDQERLTRELEELRAELAGEETSPFERLSR